MRRVLLPALAMLATIPAQSLAIGYDPVVADLKCFATYTRALGMAAENDDTSAMIESGQTFFAGKLYGRDPQFDIATAFRRYPTSVDPDHSDDDLDRCDEEIGLREHAMDMASLALSSEDERAYAAKSIQIAAVRGGTAARAGR